MLNTFSLKTYSLRSDQYSLSSYIVTGVCSKVKRLFFIGKTARWPAFTL